MPSRQLYKRLFEMPCRHATIKTRPPSASTSAISAAFSSGVQRRRRSTTTSPSTPKTPSGPSRRTKLPSTPPPRPHAAGRFTPGAYRAAAQDALPDEPSGGQSGTGVDLIAAGAAEGKGFERGQLTVWSHHVIIRDLDRGDTAADPIRVYGECREAVGVRGVSHRRPRRLLLDVDRRALAGLRVGVRRPR